MRDVAHDGWLCTLTVKQQLEISLSSQLGSSFQGMQLVVSRRGRRYRTSITCKITPAGSLSSGQPGARPCWASTLAFGLIGTNQTNMNNNIRAVHYSHVAHTVGRAQGVYKPLR